MISAKTLLILIVVIFIALVVSTFAFGKNTLNFFNKEGFISGGNKKKNITSPLTVQNSVAPVVYDVDDHGNFFYKKLMP